MCKLSNSKIEKRAIEALENIINKHYTMDHQFNSMDKEMSWDGYIWIYKNINGTQDKTTTRCFGITMPHSFMSLLNKS